VLKLFQDCGAIPSCENKWNSVDQEPLSQGKALFPTQIDVEDGEIKTVRSIAACPSSRLGAISMTDTFKRSSISFTIIATRNSSSTTSARRGIEVGKKSCVERLKEFLADIRTWEGGVRQSLPTSNAIRKKSSACHGRPAKIISGAAYGGWILFLFDHADDVVFVTIEA